MHMLLSLVFALSTVVNFTDFPSDLVSKITTPTYPVTSIQKVDSHRLNFTTYAAFYDPDNKYRYFMHDVVPIPTWLLIMRDSHGHKWDEMWHRGTHEGHNCNVYDNGNFLFHIKTVGFFAQDVFVKVFYSVIDLTQGSLAVMTIDKGYVPSGKNKVTDFQVVVWAFPHPKIPKLTVVYVKATIESPFPINMIKENLKWHLDSMVENFGERFLVH